MELETTMKTIVLGCALMGVMACASEQGTSKDAGAPSGAGGARASGVGGMTATGGGGSGPGGGGVGGFGAGAGGLGAGGTGLGAGGRVVGVGGAPAGGGGNGAGGAAVSTFAVVTNRYDNVRSGSNTSETILNTSNVNATSFGLLFSRTITGFVYGQPLYVGGLTVNGAKHNVVYVATEHNMLYAFDADAATPDTALWSKMLGTPVTLGAGADYDPGCTDMRNEVGITSTPVISQADGKIYVVAKTSAGQELHALDLATGAEAAGSPVIVGAMPAGAFDGRIHLSRAGLVFVGGTIYIAYSSHCDAGAYHGWMFGYDAQTLALKSVYNPTPTGTQGSIWQSGTAPATDGTSFWATVGNGTTGGSNMGNNVVRLTPSGAGMTVAAHYQARVSGDNDLQSGAVPLGTTGQVAAGGKDGVILLLNQTDMTLRQMVTLGGELNAFVFWNGSAGPTLFAWPVAGGLHAYQVGAGTLTDKGANTERQPAHPSGIFTVSSNGTTAGTGIVWATVPLIGDAWHATATGALYAFDASNVARASLWNSNLAAADNLGVFAKYSVPIVANGKVYVGTFSGKLRVYGLK
jgi:PQQ-like domain